MNLAEAEARDAADPLRAYRSQFRLPEGVIYLDGNSLGPLPAATIDRLSAVVRDEWGRSLIGSWNDHDWIGAPLRIGEKIGRLIGAAPGTTITTDSTSVNLFKLLIAAGELAPGRPQILAEAGNFPTDLHVARRAAELLGCQLRAVASEELAAAIGPHTRLVVLSHVHYRTGHRHDIAALNALARRHEARIVWDLSHSVGAVRSM